MVGRAGKVILQFSLDLMKLMVLYHLSQFLSIIILPFVHPLVNTYSYLCCMQTSGLKNMNNTSHYHP